MAKKALDKCQVPDAISKKITGNPNFLDIYSIQVINYTSSTGPNDTIQNDPNQLAEHQLQYFLVSKQLFHTLSRSRHNNHNRSAFDCEPTRSYVNVICTHLSHLGHGRSHCKYCHFQNPSNASACPTKNPLLLSFVGSVQLRASATASGGCSWSCRTCGWPATINKGWYTMGTWKGQKEWHDKGNAWKHAFWDWSFVSCLRVILWVILLLVK